MNFAGVNTYRIVPIIMQDRNADLLLKKLCGLIKMISLRGFWLSGDISK